MLYHYLTERITSKDHTVWVCLSGISWGNELRFGKYSPPDESLLFSPLWPSLSRSFPPPVVPPCLFYSLSQRNNFQLCVFVIYFLIFYFCNLCSAFFVLLHLSLFLWNVWRAAPLSVFVGASVDRFRIQKYQTQHMGQIRLLEEKFIHFCTLQVVSHSYNVYYSLVLHLFLFAVHLMFSFLAFVVVSCIFEWPWPCHLFLFKVVSLDKLLYSGSIPVFECASAMFFLLVPCLQISGL